MVTSDLKQTFEVSDLDGRKGVGALAGEAEIASYAYERLDGSGYYREAKAGGIPIEGQILAAAAALAALCVERPWREAFADAKAESLLMEEAAIRGP